MASTLVDCGPFLRWTLAVVAGGGTAALFQGLTTVARQVSSISTGGLGNPVLATVEGGSSALLAVLAVTLPVLALALIAVLLVLVVKLLPLRRTAARPT
jgi:ABC-type proline/glycine betaine transport system permease subunit